MYLDRSLLAVVAGVALLVASCGGATDVEADPGAAPVEVAPDDDARDDEPYEGSDAPGDEPAAEPEPAPEREPEVDGDGPATDVEVVAAHAPPPEPTAYELSPDEMLPNAKRYAIDVVETLLTYDPDEPAHDVATRVAGEAGAGPLLATAEPVFHEDAWSRGAVVYPQLGGFTATSASVMVVAVQSVGLPDGEVFEESRTFDVRLAIEDGAWTFDHLASAGGYAVERPDDLPDIAAAVLDDDRIELPDTARWDIHSGRVRPTLLSLMAAMAEHTPYGVIVLDTGHPWEVFGTDRQSRHTLGRAVDVYRLGDTHVIDDRADDSDTRAFVEWLYEQPGLRNVGSPWALDAFGGRSFTDDLHQDHLHIEAVPDDAPEA